MWRQRWPGWAFQGLVLTNHGTTSLGGNPHAFMSIQGCRQDGTFIQPDFNPDLANFELLQLPGPACPFLMPLPRRCDSSARPCGRIQAQVLAYSNDLGPFRAHQVGYSLPCRSVGADAGRLGGRHPQPLGLKISLEVLVASKSCRRRSFRIVVNCVNRTVVYPKVNVISGGPPMGL